jgi:hypothetical protein
MRDALTSIQHRLKDALSPTAHVAFGWGDEAVFPSFFIAAADERDASAGKPCGAALGELSLAILCLADEASNARELAEAALTVIRAAQISPIPIYAWDYASSPPSPLAQTGVTLASSCEAQEVRLPRHPEVACVRIAAKFLFKET